MSNNKTSRDYFWPSYVDLMTSLFVVMLVLFVISYLSFSRKNAELAAKAKDMERIQQINKALNELDKRYFMIDTASNRYKLLVDVSFKGNSADINTVPPAQRGELKTAGQILHQKMNLLSNNKMTSDISYLLIIEGHAQRSIYNHVPNWKSDPDRGYELSYQRALALKNYWKENGYDFNSFYNCEILVVGSGYFGKSRDIDEKKNKRFTIQITPKFKIN